MRPRELVDRGGLPARVNSGEGFGDYGHSRGDYVAIGARRERKL